MVGKLLRLGFCWCFGIFKILKCIRNIDVDLCKREIENSEKIQMHKVVWENCPQCPYGMRILLTVLNPTFLKVKVDMETFSNRQDPWWLRPNAWDSKYKRCPKHPFLWFSQRKPRFLSFLHWEKSRWENSPKKHLWEIWRNLVFSLLLEKRFFLSPQHW